MLRMRRLEVSQLVEHIVGRQQHFALLEALRALVAADELTISDGSQPIRDPAKIDEILTAELEASLQRLAGLALLVEPPRPRLVGSL